MESHERDQAAARVRLLAERERLVALARSIEETRAEEGAIDMLSGDAGASTTEAATTLGMRNDLRRQLDEVDAAVERIEAGTYGIDEITGEPIDPERLEAEPTARTNVGS